MQLILQGVVLFLIGLIFCAIGIVNLRRRRPILFPAYWFGGLFLVCILSPLIPLLLHLDIAGAWLILLAVAQIAFMVYFARLVFRGHIVMGMTADVVQEACEFAFREGQESFELTLNGYRLAGRTERLDVSIQNALGSGLIRNANKVLGSDAPGFLDRVHEVFQEKEEEFMPKHFYLILASGALLLAAGAMLVGLKFF
ncbi:MAG: hypothetical protein ACPG31_02020 [Planctomycetota bacterium]